MSDEATDWSGRAIFVLAIGIAIGFVIAVLAVAVSPIPFGGNSRNALSAGFGAIVGIISTYVITNRRRNTESPPKG